MNMKTCFEKSLWCKRNKILHVIHVPYLFNKLSIYGYTQRCGLHTLIIHVAMGNSSRVDLTPA